MNKDEIRADPDKLKAITSMPEPENVSQLKSFLGMVNFYAKFMPNFSDILHPLHQLLLKGQQWEWTKQRSQTFERVKKFLVSSEVPTESL